MDEEREKGLLSEVSRSKKEIPRHFSFENSFIILTACDSILIPYHSIVEVLNLNHVKHLRVGDEKTRGISGGQKRRLNIAMELAAAPLILFLDEPTTGLDASSALEVCEVLNKIAKLTSINVVVVIHQPRVEIWNSLDNLLILAPGGKTVYLGPQRYAQKYFERHLEVEFKPFENPADTLMDAISKFGLAYADKWKADGPSLLESIMQGTKIKENKSKKENGSETNTSESRTSSEVLANNTSERNYEGFDIKKIAKRRGANFFMQIIYAHGRALKQQAVGYLSLLLEFGLALLAGILIGLATTGSYRGLLKVPYILISASPAELIIPLKALFMNISIGLVGATAGVRAFGSDRVTYWREAAAGHNRASYFLGVTIAYFYRIAMSSLHFVIILYVVGMPISDLSRMYAIGFSTFFAVYGIGCVCSILFDPTDAPLTSVIATLVAAVMSGFISVFPLGLKAISYAFWSSEAFYAGEVEPFGNIFDLDSSSKGWEYTRDRFAVDIGVVISLGVAYRVIAFIFMVLLNRDKQR